jgi:ketosteroid isomerase-like protein
MRFALTAFIIIALSAAAAPQARRSRPPAKPQQPSQEADRKAIEDLHQRDIAASLAFDIDKLVSLWDDNIVAMPPSSAPLVGVEANRAYLARNREKMANVDILAYEEQWDEVRILGDYAYEYGSIRSRMRGADARQETAMAFNVMRVLKRQPGGDWKVYRTMWNDRGPAEPPTPPPKSSAPQPGF